jgi:hypothetical protein
MMFYTSKLLADVNLMQEKAEVSVLNFPDPLQHALALADHFENIQPEEYVIPRMMTIGARSETYETQALHQQQYTPL